MLIKKFIKKYKFLNSLFEFTRNIFLVSKFGIERDKKKILLIIIANFLGTLTAASTFGILLGYARQKISGKIISFKGVQLPELEGYFGLIVFGLAALVFGILSALSTYWSQKEILKLSQIYHKDIMARAIVAFNKNVFNKNLTKKNAQFLTKSHDRRYIPTIYANYVSITFKTVLDTIQPIIVLVFSVSVLFYLNISASIILLPSIIIYGLYIVKLSKVNSTYQGRYLSKISELNPKIFEILNILKDNPNPFYEKELFSKILDEWKIKELLFPFYGRILSSYKSNMYTNIFLVISMVILFVYFGGLTIQEKISWTAIITFLIALRFAGQSMKKVSVLVVNISKFYPSVLIFIDYVLNAEDDISHKNAYRSSHINVANLELNNRVRFFPYADKNKKIEIGNKSFLFYNGSIDENNKAGLLQIILKNMFKGKIDNQKVIIHKLPELINNISFAENALGLSHCTQLIDDLYAKLTMLDVREDFMNIPMGLFAGCTLNSAKKLSNEAKIALSLYHTFNQENRIIFVMCDRLIELDKIFLNKLLKLWKSNNKIIFFSDNFEILMKFYDKYFTDQIYPFIIIFDSNTIYFCNRNEINLNKKFIDDNLERKFVTGGDKEKSDIIFAENEFI